MRTKNKPTCKHLAVIRKPNPNVDYAVKSFIQTLYARVLQDKE